MLTSTPDSTLPLKFHSLSSLPSPAPFPIYSVPAPQNQLQPVGASPPAFASTSPSTHVYSNMRSPRGQLRPIQLVTRTSPLFAAPPQLVVPQPRETTVVRLPTVPVSRAALVGYTPALSHNSWIGTELTYNWPYPDPIIFASKLWKAIGKISPLLVFYQSQGETLFNYPSIWNLYKCNLNDICNVIQSANTML